MSYEELEQLFYAGELDLCISEGEEYLLDNPKDTDVLFLMSIAHHDRALEEGPDEAYRVIHKHVIPYLKRVLNYEPNNPRVLYNLLNYQLGNQYVLEQIARPNIDLTQKNKPELLEYAERLKQDPLNKVFGLEFEIKIYEILKEDEALLKALNEAISFFEIEFAENRELKDRNISICWIKKIYFLGRDGVTEKSAIAEQIDKGIFHFVSPKDIEYLDLAEIAFEANALDVALKVLLKLVKGDNHEPEVLEGFLKWHQRFKEQIELGYTNPEVFYYQLIIERNYFEALEVPEDYYYQHGLEILGKYPNNFAANHFVGTYLYEMGNFDEAYSVLKKGVSIHPDVTTWRRMVESQLLSTGLVEQEVPVFSSLPRDIYNEGVNLDDFLKNMAEDAIKEALRTLDVKLYQQSFDAFRKYFEDFAYESDFYGDEHCWAMCCNNLAIVYTVLGDYQAAVLAIEEGMKHSEFPELHHTLIDALLKQEDFQKTHKALEAYFSIYDEKSASFYRHLQHKADLVIVNQKLELSSDIKWDAEELLFEIYEHYNENPDISDFDFRDFEAAKNTVESILYHELENNTAPERINYYSIIAEKYPDEANPQYNLMQAFNELGDYDQVNKSARLYLENKASFLLNDFDKAKTIYLIVKSHYLLSQYREGAAMFSDYDEFCLETLECNEYVLWLSYGIKLYDKQNDLSQVNGLVDRFLEIYKVEEWAYDILSEEILLAKAHVNYQKGYLKDAHKILDYILSYDDHNAIAEHFKQTWKKPGLLSKLGF